jgi:hypothetical protein
MLTWMKEDRVRRNSTRAANDRLDREAEERVARYANSDGNEIQARIDVLAQEWDVERWLETNASILALAGTALGYFVDRRWLALPAVVTAFLLQHALQGWCPPVPAFRFFGVRTRQEIDREIAALKALRGDFRGAAVPAGPDERAHHVLRAAEHAPGPAGQH